MKLKDLLKPIDATVAPELEAEVSDLVFDTRNLKPGCVFIAVRGGRHDGHDFLAEAASQGAVALVVEDATRVPKYFRGYVHKVSSSRAELSRLAARWAGEPSQNLFTVGVTGTNGKTTTTNMIESVLNHGGLLTGVIGTIDHHVGSRTWPTEMTTPDPIAFQKRLRDFVDAGARAVALEVSSHALDQARVDAVEFNVGVFTNLTRDHLDYHGTMENYFEAKRRFFTELLVKSAKSETIAIINVGDEWGAKLARHLLDDEVKRGLAKPRVWTVNAKGATPKTTRANDFEYEIEEQGFDGVRFSLSTPRGIFRLKLAMAGIHNVQNSIGAFATGLAAGMDAKIVTEAIGLIRGVRGRLEPVPNKKGLHVFVDYAHTDDALIAILKLLGQIRAEAKSRGHSDGNARIITVFGCGGDRDRGKRPLMMKAALGGSDAVIVTSDNPRSENPDRIIDDAMAAAGPHDKNKVHRQVDRRLAIAHAIQQAKPGDVVLIAGKGHEATQRIGNVKTPFSDVDVAREFLEETHGRTRI